MVTWQYENRARPGAMSLVVGLLCLVVAPMVLTGWALVHWFPLSIPIFVTIAALTYVGIYATAVDEEAI